MPLVILSDRESEASKNENDENISQSIGKKKTETPKTVAKKEASKKIRGKFKIFLNYV